MFAFLDGAIAQADQIKEEAEQARRREEIRVKADNDRKMREEVALRIFQTSTEYLLNACNIAAPASDFSMKGFTDAVNELMALGELCGKDEMELIHNALLTRPEFMYFAALRTYFKRTQDVVVGALYLERFLTIPETTEQLSHVDPTVTAAKAALVIAAEYYGEKPEMLKKFATLILERFPGMPVSEYQGFRGLLHHVAKSGVLKGEGVKIPQPTSWDNQQHRAPSKPVPQVESDDKSAAANRVQAMVLPGVTASLKDLVSNNATARAKAAKKIKRNKAA